MKELSKSAPRPGAAPNGKAAAKGIPIAWWAGGGGIIALLVALILFVALRGGTGLSDNEGAVIKRLEDAFEAKYKVDESNRVQRVELEGPHVTDEALKDVAKLKFVKELSLARSSVTDIGLEQLREMKRLHGLGITDTVVSDRGLKQLEKIPTLKYLWLCEGAGLTKEGIAAFKKVAPGVTVYVMNAPKKKADGAEKK